MFVKMGKLNIFLCLLLIFIFGAMFFVRSNNSISVESYTDVGHPKYFGDIFRVDNDNDITISFNFYINSLKNPVKKIRYENIFQTANVNKGIRVEIARRVGSPAGWAMVYSDKQGKLKGVDLGGMPAEDTWHFMQIKYFGKTDQLYVYVDNKIVKSINKSNIKLDFSNIVVGYGFSPERTFNGVVSNFKVARKSLNDIGGKILYVVAMIIILIMARTLIFKFYRYSFGAAGKYISKYSARNIFASLCLLLFVLLLVVQYAHKVTVRDYTSFDNPVKIGKALNINNSMSIGFEFYIDPLEKDVDGIQYENIFQTADWNNGFRVELARKTKSATLWGVVYTDTKGKLRVIQLGAIPELSKWHTMRIVYLKDKNRIDVFVNGIDIRSYDDANPSVRFDNVIVGQAFGDRRFHGKVRNFTINKSLTPMVLYVLLLIVSVAMIMSLMIEGVKRHYISTDAYDKKKVFRKSLMVVAALSFFSIFIFYAESYLVGENDIFRMINIFLIILSFVIFIVFLNNLHKKSLLSKTIMALLYVSFCAYLSLFFVSALYMIGRYSDQVRRPYGLSIDEIAAIYQSSFYEGVQFIITSLGYPALIAIVVVPIILTCVLYLFLKGVRVDRKHKRLTLSYTVLTVAAFYIVLPSIPTYPKVIYAGFQRYSQLVNEMKKLKSARDNINFAISVDNDRPSTHIVIIGESENKEHMGAYGYYRKTTPWLTSMIKDDKFIRFDNAYSPYCHTVPSVMKMITAANQYNQKEQKKAVSLIDIANKAGFKTYWIDEQRVSLIDTPLTVVINACDEVKFVEEGYVVGAVRNVMEHLDEHRNNLIFIHIMGSHADYRERIVGYKDVFTGVKREDVGNYANPKYKKFITTLLNPYDSTIRYTDMLLGKIFNETAKKYPFVDSIVYMSDHGEDVFGRKFHNSADFSWPMVHIPFVVYFSDRYKHSFQSDVSLIRRRTNTIFTTDLLYDTLLDLYHIHSDKFETGYSLLDDDYKINESNAIAMQKSPDEDDTYYTMTTRRYIKDDPLYIAKKNLAYLNRHYPGKILSVDNDLIGKAYQSAALGFDGVEFNVDLTRYAIGHYPEYSFSTTLEQYLGLPPIGRMQRLWFDMKTPKGQGISSALKKFEALDERYNLKDRALIESWESGLSDFREHGWSTSYYVYIVPAAKNYSSKFPGCAKDEKCAERILAKFSASGAANISFFYSDYAFVKAKLEPLLPSGVSYNIFGLPFDYQVTNKDMISNVEKSKVFNDKRVKTILLEVPTRYRYRPE